MSAEQIGELMGSVLMLLFVAAIWLLIARIIPPLRRAPGIANVVAAILVCLAAYASFAGGGSATFPVVAAVIVLGMLCWNYHRDVRLLARKTNTDAVHKR